MIIGTFDCLEDNYTAIVSDCYVNILMTYMHRKTVLKGFNFEIADGNSVAEEHT